MIARRMAVISAAACFALVAMTLTASGVESWNDPAVNAENRLPARTFLPRDGYVLSLDGTWSFAWKCSKPAIVAVLFAGGNPIVGGV